MKYVIKLYFLYFLIFFCRDLSFAFGNEDIILRWPSLNIISSLLQINDLFVNDFYTNSILNTPLRTIINTFYLILPKTHFELISAYSIFSIIFKSLLPITFIFLASSITTLILRESNSIKNLNIKNNFAYSFFIGNVIYYISQQSENLKNILFGTPIALWGFPTALATSRGISLFISLISINIILLISLFKPDNYKLNKYLISFLFLVNLLASVIHPISPLVTLVIIFLLNIYKKNLLSWFNLFFVYFSSWILGVIIILSLYPQGDIDNLDLFRIYIENTHNHHYLPSHYFNQILDWQFLIYNFIISVFFIIFHKNNKFLKDIFSRLLFTNIFVIAFINIIQYLFVEIYKETIFIKLGLTFLNISYNFFYFLSILLFLSLYLPRYKVSLSNKFKFLKSNKNLRFIDLICISLSIFVLILTTSVFDSNIVKIKESNSYNLGVRIKSLNKDNSEFIIDPELANDFKYPRELGLINIFNDSYFPFNIESIKLWENKSIDLIALENCLKSEKDKCYLPVKYQKKIFYISKNKKIKLGKEIFNEKIKDIPIFIYSIEKK